MTWWTVKPKQLLEASELELENLARSGPAMMQQAADRVMENATDYQIWFRLHESYMNQVGYAGSYSRQLYAMRSLAMSLVHSRGLVTFIRDFKIRDEDRVDIIRHFHGPKDYAQAIIHEHQSYNRRTVSYSCALGLGKKIMHDAIFESWMTDYERMYNEYFACFAMSTINRKRAEKFGWDESFLPFLKSRVEKRRKEILALPRVPVRSRDGFELRAKTGDTGEISIANGLRDILRKRYQVSV